MKLPSLFSAAIAGLWQHPLLPEETVTSTQHVLITKTITAVPSNVYAMRFGSSTWVMEYVPASIIAKVSSQVAAQTTALLTSNEPSGHLELRSAEDTISTRHVKVTMTVQSVEATVYAKSVESSVMTLTSDPESLVAEATSEIAAESSNAAFAISSAEVEAMEHSTVTALAVETPAASGSIINDNNATSLNTAKTTVPTASVPTTQKPLHSTSASSSTTPALGLELRSDGDVTSTSHVHITKTVAEAQSKVYEVVASSVTSSMSSVSATIAVIASSEAAATAGASSSSSTVAVDAASASAPETTEQSNKSTRTASVENEVKSSSQSSTSHAMSAISNTLSSSPSIAASSSSSSGESTSTIETTSISQSIASTLSSDSVLTTLTTAWTPSASSSVSSTSALNSESTSVAATLSSDAASSTSAADSSSASNAAIAADNAAGASGSDTSSFKLSKGGFAAIISVVSIGVGLGIIFLILFVVAKRRQWKVRAAIARASRRLTGRANPRNPPASETEKEATLPTIQPRSAIPNRPAAFRPEIRNARAAGVGADRMPVGVGGIRPPGREGRFPVRPQGTSGLGRVVVSGGLGQAGTGVQLRDASWEERQGSSGTGGSGERRVKPELRVDTRLAREMEEGGVREKGGWVRRMVSRVRERE